MTPSLYGMRGAGPRQTLPAGPVEGAGPAGPGGAQVVPWRAVAQAMALRLRAADLDLDSRPGEPDPRGHEPPAAPAPPEAAAPAGSLHLAWAHAGPHAAVQAAAPATRPPGGRRNGLELPALRDTGDAGDDGAASRVDPVGQVEMAQVQLPHEAVMRGGMALLHFQQAGTVGFHASAGAAADAGPQAPRAGAVAGQRPPHRAAPGADDDAKLRAPAHRPTGRTPPGPAPLPLPLPIPTLRQHLVRHGRRIAPGITDMRTLVFAACVAAVLPLWLHNPYQLQLCGTLFIHAIVLSGLALVVGCTGLVSLGHAGLFGIGAYTAGVLVLKLGLPMAATLPAAMAAAAACGALLALPALRATGPGLAMATLAFGSIVQVLINEAGGLTAGPMGITLGPPSLGGLPLGPRGFFWLVAALAIAALALVQRVLRSHVGRAFEALRASPVAADCAGVGAYRHKVVAFVLSAALAGLAGALHAWSEQYIAPDTYGFELSVLFLLGVLAGGRRSGTGVLLGAALVVLLPQLLDDVVLLRAAATALALGVAALAAWRWRRHGVPVARLAAPVLGSAALAALSFLLPGLADWRPTVFGLIALGVVHALPDGLAGALRQALGRTADAPDPALDLAAVPAQARAGDGITRPAGCAGPLLQARHVSVSFGGLRALDAAGLTVQRGCVHGLIGPNGSGKTTLLDVLTGLRAAGRLASLRLDGMELAGLGPVQMARAGIARTFQNARLFEDMSVLDNVLVGLHHSFRSGLRDVLLRSPRCCREERAAQRRARRLLRLVGLQAHQSQPAGSLPYGQQRLLEIARALAQDPCLLLLDEPAAGLTQPETRALAALIRRIRDRGVGVLLIEHQMDLVKGLCDTITVLDFGRSIAQGTPRRVLADEAVIDAYLNPPRRMAAC
jgi:ABC-type branched-subunit amino acid transport system ATPase component/ABC-type branched-subunit amino acid transport system permease subunit